MRTTTRSFYQQAVERAIARVAGGLDGGLELRTLAAEAALSPFHFHRIFKGMTGETPLELHRRLRLERAAWCLLHRDESVTAIAFAAGYETHESFTRAFRASHGKTPSEYRAGVQPDEAGCVPPRIELPARSGIHYSVDGPRPIVLPPPRGADMDVELKDLPEIRVATVLHTGPYQRIPAAFAKLAALAGPAGLLGPDTQVIAVYHDDPETTPAAELRSHAGLTVPPSKPLPDGLCEWLIPPGRYAVTIHRGPYETLGDAWLRLMGDWLPASGLRLRDEAPYEIYLNDPAKTPRDRLETEIRLPLA